LELPFCVLKNIKNSEKEELNDDDISLGSIYDIDVAMNIIMKDNGFHEDNFS